MRPHPVLLLCVLGLLAGPLSAQDTPALDAKTRAQYERLLKHKYSRDLNDVFSAMEKSGRTDLSAAADARFLQSFRLGDWAQVKAELARLPADLSRPIYDKMLADLAERPKSGVRLDDVFALADASPAPLDSAQLRRLGQMLGQVVSPGETFWVAERLERGTPQFGGQDPLKRLAAGQLLMAGGFKDLARQYLPDQAGLERVADEGLRQEIAAFLQSEQASELAQRDEVQRIWDENIRVLTQARGNDWEKTKAASAMLRVLTQVPGPALGRTFAELLRSHPDAALRLVAGLARKTQSDARGEAAVRLDNLRATAVLAGLVAEFGDAADRNWNQVLVIMAESWMSEVDVTSGQRGAGRNRSRPAGVEIDAEELLLLAPAGKWLAALPESVRERLDAALSRAIIASANFEVAADRIVEFSRRHPTAGVALAEDFLVAWGQAHNPQLPEELRRRYGLPEDARIPVTPVMMERNIDSLARMMEIFRKAGVTPRDQGKIVAAFDLAYSNAEAYRESHIEKVFGPVAKMDDELFGLLVQRMHANLTDRWRRMDLQRNGLTRRNEAQTYAMVSDGYAALVRMLDSRTGGDAAPWSPLTLAGTVLNDWADFESFQELMPVEPARRAVAAKEKSLRSLDYFERGAKAYARDVAALSPGGLSIDPYLAWFNAILGIGSGGHLNLTKPVNRAGLDRIRTAVLALPGKAAATHMGQLAKTLNARLSDERNPLHEDLKYRYLTATLVVTKDDPFTLGLKKRADYLDELLSEIRLQTRVDGPNTVGSGQDFGIVVSVIHSEAMGRVARFGQYLSNDPAAVAGKARRRGPQVSKGPEPQGPRDELEQGLNETLSPFFTIRSITFATPDVKPRPTARPGWEETVLAYVLVRAKDASVDKIPPVKMELRFLDLSGPVTVPAVSAETLLKVATAKAPPRPADKVEVTQTLDTRQFGISGALSLEVSAVANGLVPELEELLDLESLRRVAAVRQVTAPEGLQVRELNTWSDQVFPRSERRWVLTLDGDPIRASEQAVEVPFPAVRLAGATSVWRTYQDVEPVVLAQPAVKLDRVKVAATTGVAAVTRADPLWWQLGAVLIVSLGAAWFLLGRRPKGPRPPRARDVFRLPDPLDAFSVVALLRKLGASPLAGLAEAQRAELAADIARVQQGCFGEAPTLSDADLRALAEKWLRALG